MATMLDERTMPNPPDPMNPLRSDLLRTLHDRRYVHQCTDVDALDGLAAEGPVTAYIGFDCTAPSLHVGSLVQIMTLRILQRCGHKPVVLMGGATTRIGDPTGRDLARQMLDDDAIAANMAGIRKVFDRFLTFGDGPTDAVMVDNADWLDGLGFIPFLRDFGRHFSVNRMLTQDAARLRLEREQNLSLLEFNYMVLQAYDFLELNRRMGVRLQCGGSDQWGNIVQGIDLARRIDGVQVFGLTTPLITSASGAKMGKTAQGAVWLNPEMLSPWDYWQFWRNVEDADVGRFLRLFTELPLDEITRLEALEGADLNEAKKILATEATTLAHGAQAAAEAADTARRTFEEGSSNAGLPVVTLERARLEAGIAVHELFAHAGLVASRSEARRLVQQGGARVNDTVVTDELRQIGLGDLGPGGVVKLSAGKKRHLLVEPV